MGIQSETRMQMEAPFNMNTMMNLPVKTCFFKKLPVQMEMKNLPGRLYGIKFCRKKQKKQTVMTIQFAVNGMSGADLRQ